MRWRTRLFSLHRDLGYLAFGLTVVYAVSGVAVNHRHHWDYNRVADRAETRVGAPALLIEGLSEERRKALEADPGSVARDEEPALVAGLSKALGRTRAPKNAFWRDPRRFSVFYETGDRDTVDYDPVAGVVRHLAVRDRPVFRDLNFLHLNERPAAWTWFADAYAIVLLFLAISGAIMVRGRKGLAGRGGVLAALGVLLPLLALALMRWS